MFKEMRRNDKLVSEAEAWAFLENCRYITLATYGEDGFPYTTPLAFVVIDKKVYFHSMNLGHKISNIKHHPKVCLSAAKDMGDFEDAFNVYFKSTIIFGTARLLEEGPLKTKALLEIAKKHQPHLMDKLDAYMNQKKMDTAVVEITPEHISGKARKLPGDE